MNFKPTLAVLSAAALLAFPAGAMGKDSVNGKSGKAEDTAKPAKTKKPKKPKVDTYEFKGLVKAVGTDGTVQVEVVSGNSRAKKLKGQTLTFDVSKAKIKVADVNADGKRDLADVAAGDRVQIQAKVVRGSDMTQVLPARQFVDKGPAAAPKPEDESKPEDEPKAPETPEVPTT